MRLFLAPHNDDEALFGSFTIYREKPLVVVVTDGTKHEQRGIVTAKERRAETEAAMKVLGAPVAFMGLSDAGLTYADVRKCLKRYRKAERVYAPAFYDKGNPDHNTVSMAALDEFGDRVTFYSTYRVDDLTPHGNVIVFPNKEEVEKKCEALGLYASQIKCNLPHFNAIIGHPEYYVV